MSDNNKKFEAVIGLEIHIQLKTRSKMFCDSPNGTPDDPPNTNICEVCTGQPGTLPVPNEEAIKKAALVGLALGCEVAEHSKFDRKNYFYPDIPKAYQISQYDQPISKNGKFTLLVNGVERTIGITRAHLEEDTGKLVHENGKSLVDYNRAGVPLLEVVTEPDFHTAEEVKQFLQSLRNIVRYIDASDADMEKGQLRGEPNISVREKGQTDLPNYKVELKNINSFKNVFDSTTYEIKRQMRFLEEGREKELVNETRGWDGKKTVRQRVKETAQDYRYFPEPDLPNLHFSKTYIEELRRSLPELPHQKERRFIDQFGLPEKDAEVLISDKSLASFFENVVSELEEWLSAEQLPEGTQQQLAKLATNFIIGELQALLKESGMSTEEMKVTAENFAELIKMVEKSEVSNTAAKQLLGLMFENGGDPSTLAKQEGLIQVSDTGEIEKFVDEAIAENEKVVSDYKSGTENAIGFLVGQVMQKSKGQANPQVAKELLEKKLG